MLHRQVNSSLTLSFEDWDDGQQELRKGGVMTPGQARGAIISFLLLLAGVSTNAILMQPRAVGSALDFAGAGRPSSAFERARGQGVPPPAKAASRIAARSTAPDEEHALQIARFAPDRAKLEEAPEQIDGVGRDTIRALQRELKALGYGPLPGDGTLGQATRAAIMAYEWDQGLALTGTASEALLQRLVLGSPRSDGAGRGKVASEHALKMLEAVEQRLAALGYRPGRVDGRMSEDTVRAIREFEVDRGLVPKGRVSAELIARLEQALPKPGG